MHSVQLMIQCVFSQQEEPVTNGSTKAFFLHFYLLPWTE